MLKSSIVQISLGVNQSPLQTKESMMNSWSVSVSSDNDRLLFGHTWKHVTCFQVWSLFIVLITLWHCFCSWRIYAARNKTSISCAVEKYLWFTVIHLMWTPLWQRLVNFNGPLQLFLTQDSIIVILPNNIPPSFHRALVPLLCRRRLLSSEMGRDTATVQFASATGSAEVLPADSRLYACEAHLNVCEAISLKPIIV